jgi:CDP-paratose 2-epimerase
VNRDLITGGAGFVGTNLADRLARDGRRVRILDDLSRPGVSANLDWLEARHPSLQVAIEDVRDAAAVARAARGVERIFHLAAQVAVTTSMHEPRRDFDVNVGGTLNLLEAARMRPRPPQVFFTSTNKVYGSLDDLALRNTGARYEPAEEAARLSGISEARPLQFHTPYGCSKGAADQYVLDYARSFVVPTVVFRMSCIYGPHQCGTEDQGWVAHFAIRALAKEPIVIYGDGRQVRDILFVDDLVEALLLASKRMDRIVGSAFNIGGGPDNAVSLLDVIEVITAIAGDAPETCFDEWRPDDQRYYVSDTSSFERHAGWRPAVSAEQGIARLCGWLDRAPGRRFNATNAIGH